jgi:DNA-binding beta-propeller fold protein YncE
MGWGGHGSEHGQFNLPWGITVDSEDGVYVADWGNHRVQKFTADGGHIASFGEVDGLGGDLRHPSDVAVDSDGDVYVADWGNRRVQIYESNGDVIAALYGDAVELSKAGEYIIRRDPGTIKAYEQVQDYTEMAHFQHPIGIVVDSEDRVIVTDSCGRLQVYAKDREYSEPDVKLYLEP